MARQKQVFSPQEQIIFALRELYESFGYARFPMRRFEEYGLYVENKSFLKSESVLAFTNANGRLMALKPDVTLSIVKQARADGQGTQKLYYNENVYRASQTDHEFAEIAQMGIESLGDVDLYGAVEVVCLAAQSLKAVHPDYVLEISHMGFAGGLMAAAGFSDAQKEELFSFIRQKNRHELRTALTRMNVGEEIAKSIEELPTLAGEAEPTLARANRLVMNEDMREALGELEAVYQALTPLGLVGRIRLDFSILNDLDYYNGLVFHGYVDGVPRMVLSGGRYDHLMRKFGKQGGGIGFALYLDELTRLLSSPQGMEVDAVLLYDRLEAPGAVLAAVESLRQKGLSVLAASRMPKDLRGPKILRLEHGAVKEVG